MKNLFTLVALVFCLQVAGQQYQKQKEASVRQNAPLESFQAQRYVLWNDGWRFADDEELTRRALQESTPSPDDEAAPEKGDPAAANYDDSAWRPVAIPHDFQFEYPWDEECGGARGFKRMGEGWYRKTFTADPLWQGKEVFIDFDGIMYQSDVYLNGYKVGSGEYGYCGYECDLSKYLLYDTLNVISIWASTGPRNGSRWYTGGGLFRDVHLKVQNPTHIARHGVYIHTPQITPEEALVQVEVEVSGFRRHSTQVIATVLSPEGEVLGTSRDTMWQLTKHTTDELKLPLISVPQPRLWSPDTPTLYSVRVEVMADGILVDRKEEHFGIRTIEYGTDFGFKLNGKKLFLKGIANHHDMGALGAASYDEAIEREMRLLKSFGFNSIRCSHNPYSKSFTRIADRVGLLIVDEIVDKWSDNEYWGGRLPFTQIWPSLIKEWVKRDRNSPSVVLWSLGNELQTRPDWSGYDTNDWGITTYRIFDVMLKRYDATRPTTVAQFPARAGAIREEKEFKTYHVAPELGVATEVNSFNYQWDAYPGYYEHAPNLILYQSEAVTNQLQAPFYGMNRDRGVGLAYWGAIAYWGESNKWPKKGWNFSFFNHNLWPRPQAYLIKGAFDYNTPVVHLGIMTGGESVNWNDVQVGQKNYTESWNHKPGSKQQVATFTNCDEVELLINGKSLGRQQNDTTSPFKRGIITWQDVPYDKGGTLTAIAYRGGKEVTRHQLEATGEASRLVFEEDPCAPKDGRIRYLWLTARDRKGRVVSLNDSVTVTLQGEGMELLALDNGDQFTDDLFLPSNTLTRTMLEGRTLVVLRTTGKTGSATLTATSGKLKGKTTLP